MHGVSVCLLGAGDRYLKNAGVAGTCDPGAWHTTMGTYCTTMVVWIILVVLEIIPPADAQKEGTEKKSDTEGSAMLIFAYVCFSVGGVLIIAGFARLIWWGWSVKQDNPRRYGASNPNFYTYYKDPWLRAPSMASLAASGSRTKPEYADNDSLQVDTDAIYAQPADADVHGIYLYSPSPTEQELSQTESQIYAEANGSGSGSGAQGIYSVPHKYNSRGIPVTSIDEEDDAGENAPALPMRTYTADDVVSLTEVDRSSMREIGYVEPPADYSPDHTGKMPDSAITAQVHADGKSVPRELSGEELYHTAVFRDSTGTEMSRFKVAPNGGSIKSMKSLFQYMASEEPCALDNEIDYTFTSSSH